jgi:hypothetical protein
MKLFVFYFLSSVCLTVNWESFKNPLKTHHHNNNMKKKRFNIEWKVSLKSGSTHERRVEEIFFIIFWRIWDFFFFNFFLVCFVLISEIFVAFLTNVRRAFFFCFQHHIYISLRHVKDFYSNLKTFWDFLIKCCSLNWEQNDNFETRKKSIFLKKGKNLIFFWTFVWVWDETCCWTHSHIMHTSHHPRLKNHYFFKVEIKFNFFRGSKLVRWCDINMNLNHFFVNLI